MMILSEADRARIAAAIARAERSTAGEILCVVARSAGDYWGVPIIWAAMIAMLTPWPLMRLGWLTPGWAFVAQWGVFMVLALVLSSSERVRLMLTPKALKRQRARHAARLHFHTQGISRTEGRTGVLIFVAVGERYAEVITDAAFAGKVGDDDWRQTLADLVAGLTAGTLGEALVGAVAQCGAILARHAPPQSGNRNELPNRVIVL